jgi:O-antigen/teichoic acid export membrane protein
VIGSGLTLAARGQGDYVIMGLLERGAAVASGTGNYYFAFTTASLPRLILTNMASTLFPVFAKVQDDAGRSRSMYARSLHALACIAFPMGVLAACLAWPAFRLLLDARWQPAAPLFSILSVTHVVLFVNAIVFQLVIAGGHFRAVFFFDLAFAPFEIGCFVVGAWAGGTIGLSVATVVSAFIGCVAWHAFAFRLLGIDWRSTMLPLWRPAVACVPVVALAWVLRPDIPSGVARDLAVIGTVTACGLTLYVGVLWLIWRPVLVDVASVLGRAFRRSRAAR